MVALLISCQKEEIVSNDQKLPRTTIDTRSEGQVINVAYLDQINSVLAAEGENYRITMAELITSGEDEEVGITIIASDVGNKQLEFDFVPNDPRRAWSGPADQASDDITYAIDQTDDATPIYGGLTIAETDAAIVRAMDTWDNQSCSDLPIVRNPDFGIDIGVVAFIYGLGGSPFIFADIHHAGWRDVNFAGNTLAATFTFGFIDEMGAFTDVNNDGKLDAAFREIYYDPSFPWADDGSTNVDVETVALHEAGHGLSQAHFGTIFFKKTGKVQFAPRAVMNAAYVGPQRELLGTDRAGHCSIWGSWPQN